ncbi:MULTISPECIES: hypothetical protein [unclassified Synechocystis]|uniref:hypothetical protein n=1 Tax=unclassified Synechocystis TaxID=2640012 RepID=UPI00118761A7|nr:MULTISPECIES: hypothetical protein [unclassified Synechocystis]MCT0253555.1 hypothetical protein [Synechocystis sp. CS-94]
MAQTLIQRFGAAATFDETAKTLTFDIDDLAGITDPSLITDLTIDEWADRIAAALLLHWRSTQGTDNTDPTEGLIVGDPFKQFETRGGENQISFNYNVAIYIPDTSADLDPDLVV